MTFNPVIPQPTNLISNSQAQILANFTSMNSIFGGVAPTTGGDHDGFNNGSGNGSGMHNQVTFTSNQSSAPSLTRNSIVGVSGLYANLSNALSELFFQNSTQNFQLTGIPLVTGTASAQGYGITTPWGLILNFGECASVATGGTEVIYQVPFTTGTLAILATARSSTGTKTASGVPTSNSRATLYSSNASLAVYFLAIGR